MTVVIGSVVIGRNEGERLIACLRSLQPGGGIVVYVDSGSTDGSVDAARSLGAKIVQLDTSIPFTAARARNEGFKALVDLVPQLTFVQFVDGDCEVNPGWLATAVNTLSSRPDVAVVCGRRRERNGNASIFNRMFDAEWNTPIGEADACGGDSLMRAAALSLVHGFNSNLMAGEEPELCARLRLAGWKILRVDAEMTLHDAAMTRMGQWWLRNVRSGFGYAQVWFNTKNTGKPLYGRELVRAMLWAGFLPLLTVAFLFVAPKAALLFLSVFVLQITRIARRRGLKEKFSWQYAFFSLLGKFPELQGALKYAVRLKSRSAGKLIEYK